MHLFAFVVHPTSDEPLRFGAMWAADMGPFSLPVRFSSRMCLSMFLRSRVDLFRYPPCVCRYSGRHVHVSDGIKGLYLG